MKKMKIPIASVTLFLACLFISCNDNPVASVNGEIKGTITSKDLNGNVTGVSQLKIYLIDTGTKPDTVNLENNKKLFIDSTFTDTDGNYKFLNLKEGKYGVSPYICSTGIKVFKEQSSPDPTNILIDNRKKDYIINFSVTYPGEDYPEDTTPFEINIIYKNLGPGFYTTAIIRHEFYCFVSYLSTYKIDFGNKNELTNRVFNSKWEYGWTSVFYTLSNKFTFSFENLAEKAVNIDYDLTLSSCPQSATFEYDYAAKTLTRINY